MRRRAAHERPSVDTIKASVLRQLPPSLLNSKGFELLAYELFSPQETGYKNLKKLAFKGDKSARKALELLRAHELRGGASLLDLPDALLWIHDDLAENPPRATKQQAKDWPRDLYICLAMRICVGFGLPRAATEDKRLCADYSASQVVAGLLKAEGIANLSPEHIERISRRLSDEQFQLLLKALDRVH